MTVVIPPAPEDLEGSLVAWLRGLGIARRVATELPANLQDPSVLPLAQITDLGGLEVARGLDAASVDCDCFQVGREPCRLFANLVRRAFQYQLPGATLAGGGVVGRVDVARRPVLLPYGDPAVYRSSATYDVHFRQPRYS